MTKADESIKNEWINVEIAGNNYMTSYLGGDTMFTFIDKNGIEVKSGDVIKFQHNDDPSAIGVFFIGNQVKIFVKNNDYVNPFVVEFQHETAEKLVSETKEFKSLVRMITHQLICTGGNKYYLQGIAKNYIKDWMV